MSEEKESSDPFVKLLLGVVTTLLVAGILGGVVLYGDMRELKTKMDSLSASSGLDQQQSESISRLWTAAAQNKAFINKLREQRNADHDGRDIDQFNWDLSGVVVPD